MLLPAQKKRLLFRGLPRIEISGDVAEWSKALPC